MKGIEDHFSTIKVFAIVLKLGGRVILVETIEKPILGGRETSCRG